MNNKTKKVIITILGLLGLIAAQVLTNLYFFTDGNFVILMLCWGLIYNIYIKLMVTKYIK